MANLADIVNVQIALNTLAVPRGTFGVALIAGPIASFTERVRTYSSADEATEDELPSNILTAITNYFSQTPHPRTVKVGRRTVSKINIKVSSLIPSGVYSFKVGATTYSFTADATPLATEIVTGLAAAVTADLSNVVSAVANADVLELTYDTPATPAAVTTLTNLFFYSIIGDTTTVAADLTAINNEDAAWYGLVMAERIKQAQLDAAAWTEARVKLFGTCSDEADILNASLATDIISVLGDANYFRTFISYSANAATQYPEAAWMGRVFTIQPGAETWALKRLAGITADRLTSTQKNTIFNKGGNTFEFYTGTNTNTEFSLTNNGKVASGEWIDVIRFRDWLADHIQTNMVQMMINRDKVPYTDPGIQLLANNLRGSLRDGQQVGGIAPDELDADGNVVPGFIMTVPLASEINAVDKASRILDLSFVARLAGAVHVVEITGALAYEF